MMTHRERWLAVLSGRHPDRIPWVPRLELWYQARLAEGNMPERFRGKTLREVERALGLADPARAAKVHNLRYEGVEVVSRRKGGEVRTDYVTPVGTVSALRRRSTDPKSNIQAALQVEHVIKGGDDLAVWRYIAEHTYYDPCYDEYEAFDRQVGDDGLPMVFAGDVPFHAFCMVLAGYNNAYYILSDHTAQVEELLTVMEQVERERLWPVLADSPAVLIRHGHNLSSQMTPPPLFRKYITPYYRDLAPLLHARGKKLAYHADNDAKQILHLVREAGFDMAEVFATAPLVEVTLAEARAAWGTDVIIYGGIPSIILEDTFPEDEFREYMSDVFRTIAPGDAFALGVADNVMPRARIERIEWISAMVEQHGQYPIAGDWGGD